MITNTESTSQIIKRRFDPIIKKVESIQSNIEWTERAIDYFGTTLKPHEAGYILYNGEMLDFYGEYVDQRRLDHAEIQQIFTEEEIEKSKKYRYNGTIQLFQTEANASRINSAQYGGYVHMAIYDTQLITIEQLKTLEYIINYDTKKHITYDILNDDSRVIRYGEAISVENLINKLYIYVQH